MQADPLIEWSNAAVEFPGFVAGFFSAGAVGFRFAVLRRRLREEQEFYHVASLRAGVIGLIGAIVTAILMVVALPEAAARAHKSVGELLAGRFIVQAQVALGLCAIVGFLLVIGKVRAGWWIAAVGVVAGALRNALIGEWIRLINPVHRLAAGFWIGTLLVMVIAGLVPVLSGRVVAERRGAVAAEIVNSFSPFALGSAFVLVIFGVWTAWRHLKYAAALWTTPYGYALIGKLSVVVIVFILGAWNWRRQRPTLGTEEAAISMRRSATAELTAALVVLVITSILVSLPEPKLPH